METLEKQNQEVGGDGTNLPFILETYAHLTSCLIQNHLMTKAVHEFLSLPLLFYIFILKALAFWDTGRKKIMMMSVTCLKLL
jgi:hypothetical protein